MWKLKILCVKFNMFMFIQIQLLLKLSGSHLSEDKSFVSEASMSSAEFDDMESITFCISSKETSKLISIFLETNEPKSHIQLDTRRDTILSVLLHLCYRYLHHAFFVIFGKRFRYESA